MDLTELGNGRFPLDLRAVQQFSLPELQATLLERRSTPRSLHSDIVIQSERFGGAHTNISITVDRG